MPDVHLEHSLVRTNTVYGMMYVLPNDSPIGESLQFYGEWARSELDVYCAYLDVGSSVIDVGANIGTHALAFARQVGSTGSVLAIEPQHVICELLKHNAQENGLHHIKAMEAAVGAENGELVVPNINYNAHFNFGGVRLAPPSRSH
jgi:tRNA G46 methylase TrmB